LTIFAVSQWQTADAKQKEAIQAQAETQKQFEEVKKLTNVFQEINNDTSLDEECRDKVVGILQRLGEDPSNLTPQTDSNASKQWTNGKTLHIKFMERNPKIESKLEEIAQEWTKYANLKFVFDSSPEAEIRISFDNVGSWSYVGTDALNIPQNTPTMNFGILELLNPDSDDFRRTVLHEFGHVLGLVEEYKLPSANIPWNKSAVYKVFGNNREWVDNYFFRKHSINYREFDRNSIMMPPIPKEWLDGNSFEPITEPNSDLSESDKAIARQWYPLN
jgi:serralysin